MSTATAGPEGMVHVGYLDITQDGVFDGAPTLGPLQYGSPTSLPESVEAQWAIWRFEAPSGRYGIDLRLSEYRDVTKRGSTEFKAVFQLVRKVAGAPFFQTEYTYGGRDAGFKYFDHGEGDEVYIAAEFADENFAAAAGFVVPRITDNGTTDWIQAPDRDAVLSYGDNYWIRPDDCDSWLPGHLQLNNEGHGSGFTWYSSLYGPSIRDRTAAHNTNWPAARKFTSQGYVYYDQDYYGANLPWKGDPSAAPERPTETSGDGGAGYVGWGVGWDSGATFVAASLSYNAHGVIYSGRHQEILSRCGKLGKGINTAPIDDVSSYFDGQPVASVQWEGGTNALPTMLDMWFKPDEGVARDQANLPVRTGDDYHTAARWFFSQYPDQPGVTGYGPYYQEDKQCRWSMNGGSPENWANEQLSLATYDGSEPGEWVHVPWEQAYQWDLDHGLIGPAAPEYVGYGGYVFSALPEAVLSDGVPEIPGNGPNPYVDAEGSNGGTAGIGSMTLRVRVRPVRFRAAFDQPTPEAVVVFPGMEGELGPVRRGFLPRR